MTIRSTDGAWIDTVCHGRVTHADIVAHIDTEAGQGLLHRPELIDATAATAAFSAAEARDLYDFVHELGQRRPLGTVAVVVNDDLTYGMVRMLGLLADRLTPVHPFRDRPTAEAWLASHR